jgi:choline dehydrogenase-like flavoprotein
MLTWDFEENLVPRERLARGSTVEADAVVVGTGAGGAVVARELAAAGMRVAVLEEGAYYTGRDYGPSTPIESIRMLYRKNGLTSTFGNVPVLLPQGCCVGGSTVINSGTALRPRASAVRRWREEFGLADLTDHLEEYARRVERFLDVKPATLSRANQLMKLGAERMGWQGSVLPRNERGCRGAGRCYLGCPNDAKQAMNVSYVPDALRRGAILYVRAKAKKVLIERGRAAGVRTTRATFRAPIVVVAAGAVYSPLLLRRGGNHFVMHPGTKVIGFFDEEVRTSQGVPQGYHLDEFMEQGVSLEPITLSPGLMGSQLPEPGAVRHFDRLATIAVRILESETEGRIFRNPFGSWPIIWYWLKPGDVDKYRRGVVVASEIYFAAGAKKVYTGIHGFEEMTPKDLPRLRSAKLAAADLELMANHPQGSARWSDHRTTGVADPDGQVWDVPGLYVADASSMPASPLSNPQISIMIFATHCARKILENSGRRLLEDADVARHHSH